MQNHEHFEELCALAAVGHLSAAEFSELGTHLNDCNACRETLHDMTLATDSWIPSSSLLSEGIASLTQRSRSGLRDEFLANARDRGINLTPQSETRPALWMRWPVSLAKPYFVATLAVAFVVSIAVLLIHTNQRVSRFGNEIYALRTQVKDLGHENTSLKEKISADEQFMAGDQSTNAATAKELTILREERDVAAANVNVLQDQIAALVKDRDQAQQQLKSTRAELAQLSQNYALVAQDLTTVRSKLESAEAKSMEGQSLLLAQQKKIEELSQRPAVESADLERDRQLLAADRDIRELMGARNLHIIDVHDRDFRGKARRSFGRVFYTEGKSLIFYAFDLSDPRLKDASFQAWGHKEDGSRKAVSLGLFYMDDKQQSRWVLRFNDPAVLAEIDSVFVTVEPPGGRKNPSGEKLLYAFLNFDANHP